MNTEPAPAGLCASCVFARAVASARGGRFVLCGRFRADARYPKYPTLPVVDCEGFERRPARRSKQDR